MNQRAFLGYCSATGMTSCLRGLAACSTAQAILFPEDRAHLSTVKIADAHSHPYQFYKSMKYDASTPTIEIMQQVGVVACSFSALGDRVEYGDISGTPFNNTMGQLNTVKRFENNKRIQLIRKPSDIPSSIEPNDAPGAVMAIEGGDALEGKIKNLDRFYQYGVCMITVLHAHNNDIGFHQRTRKDGPLTPFGVKVVERMNELGMVIDVAHSKTRTLKGISEVSAAPLVDSHTNPMPYCYKHPNPTRLRYWSEMEIIAKTGGVIRTWPAACTTKYRDPRTTLQHWAQEIVEMKKRIGMDHVGLGTDGGGNLSRKVKNWRSIMSLPRLIHAMREAGLSQDDMAAYLGGNFLRVLNRCLS